MPTKKIKSYEAACKALNQDPTLPEFPALSAAEKKAAIAHYKLVIIAKALNGEWKPDWGDWGQDKYFPWFDFRDGRFVFNSVNYFYSYSYLGSRLCFRDRDTAKYAATQFIDLYNDYYLLE
ncbi:MAG TPA: hypothetical protein VFX43_18915 [Chitinophagaceae bacterium]|nr:hypothetical protein [Chitinophagaceae bacterium]